MLCFISFMVLNNLYFFKNIYYEMSTRNYRQNNITFGL